ncbi:MAG: hypothetical protein B5M53_03320 [Candidatus Cloacimonas sp. 4484_209]|nr:MAG: hypothetical protein B5M53_03320 [Candidatus Cloacimonas sp. 4484_209]
MKIGRFLYRYRSITPIFFVILLLIFAKPTISTIAIGFCVSIIGELLRLISVGYSGLSTRSKNLRTEVLVTNGPYGYVRNPIYVGNFFLSCGVVLAANALFPYFILLFILLFFFQYYFIVRYEEVFLTERFGQDYLSYKKKVFAFIPRFVPYKAATPQKPDLKKALFSERTTIFVVMGLFLIIAAIYLIKICIFA